MVYLIIVIAVLAGAVTSLVFWSMYVAKKAEVAPLQVQLASMTAAKDVVVVNWRDQQVRYEAVIEALKKEVATIEANLQTCRDPAVIRDRLRRLLGSQEVGLPSGAPAAPVGAAPGGGAPKP
jgi:flagellar basal body-associated protein FliL